MFHELGSEVIYLEYRCLVSMKLVSPRFPFLYSSELPFPELCAKGIFVKETATVAYAGVETAESLRISEPNRSGSPMLTDVEQNMDI